MTQIVKLGDPTKFDFVSYDPVGQRVYVAQGSETTVVDGQSGKVLGRGHAGGEGRGVAVVPELLRWTQKLAALSRQNKRI